MPRKSGLTPWGKATTFPTKYFPIRFGGELKGKALLSFWLLERKARGMHLLGIIIILLIVFLCLKTMWGEWRDSFVIEGKRKHKEWLSYQTPERKDFEKKWEEYKRRRDKAERARIGIFEVAMKRGYRWKKYTEIKSYANWEEEQTEINGRVWDWKLVQNWEEECKKHRKKWGESSSA